MTQGLTNSDRIMDSGKKFIEVIQDALVSADDRFMQFVLKIPMPDRNRLDVPWVTGYGKLQSWSPGGKAEKLLDCYTISIPVQPLEETFRVPYQDLNSLPVLSQVFNNLAGKASSYLADQVATALTGGTANSANAGDGLATFSTSHLGANGATQSNKSNLALTYGNVNTVISAMKNFTDEAGNPIHVKPRYCVYGPQNAKAAQEVLGAPLLSGSGGSNVMNGMLIPIEMDTIVGGTWYVLADNAVLLGVHEDLKPVTDADLPYRDKPSVAFGVTAYYALDLGPWFNCYINIA